jgi:flagellar motility protein MotE (MotC chaperone)
MTSVTIDGDEVPNTPDVPDVLDERRQKRLAQLVIARQKAAEIKKRRSAPKKELKKLEDDIKERLYQEETERVKKLRDLHDNAMTLPYLLHQHQHPHQRRLSHHLSVAVAIWLT